MPKEFHSKPFDESTLLKLELYRQYVREWLPVFLTETVLTSKYRSINIYDFFCGPGSDKDGTPGSPIIAIDEIKKCFNELGFRLRSGITITLHCNDNEPGHIEALKSTLAKIVIDERIEVRCSNQIFIEAFEAVFSDIKSPHSANLVFLDPFGVSQAPQDTVIRLASCPTTDVILFSPSSSIKRFASTSAFQAYTNCSPEDVANIKHEHIHRFVCEKYRSQIPANKQYFYAPFSIKKGSNIYGLIYGTGHYLGLEKFLDVCWKSDELRGEANYDIDFDCIVPGLQSLWAEMDIPEKVTRFHSDLVEYIRTSKPDNVMVCRFCLENGFLPKHGTAALESMLKAGQIRKLDLFSNEVISKRGVYINLAEPKVRFEIAGN